MFEDFTNLDVLFHPNSVAIEGASSTPTSGGYDFTRYLIDYNFTSRIYPINPRANEALDLRAYPSLRDIPEPKVDYVICCIPAEGVLALLKDCKTKNVKLIYLFTGRMRATGRDKKTKLEREILEKAKSYSMRILGPNCMGIYYPQIGLSFNLDLPKEGGFVRGFFQSGGGAGEFVRYAALRGVHFSKVISYSNALDMNETELLYYFAQDPETKLIAAYIEGAKDGREFIQALSYATMRKPVIILKGGRERVGSKLAFSHTASLTGSMKIWTAISKQYGATTVHNFQELVDQVVVFSFLPPITGKKAIIAGGGGGKSVIAADVWEEEGLQLPDLSPVVREKLKEEIPEAWDWVRNPVDASILPKAPILPVNLVRMISNERSAIAEIRKYIINQGIHVFPSPNRAARALRRFVACWIWKLERYHDVSKGDEN